MNKYIYTLVFTFCALTISHAQAIKDQYIVTLRKGQIERFKSELAKSSSTRNIRSKVLSKDMNIVQLFLSMGNNQEFEKLLSANPLVEHWGYNYKVTPRKTPNDEYFDMQFGLELISAPDAWEVTTGGRDILGNEIVVAVLDDSYDLNHPELDGVIFLNENEIPDDGIDNDNNGYVDDYQGWNTIDQNDDHPTTDNHGNAVAGIIGANGDNELGIAGINWDVKVLPISGISTQAEVIGGYQYAIDMRRLYNESNGELGAYIVVTNYSAGIDGADGTQPQFKSWCDMYDNMAEVGILSTGATANNNTNVDEEGDIPTTCPSPFLISVTNVDINDTKVTKAGFGQVNIDLGAPGKGTLALGIGDGYDQSFGGTSAATPHVAGTIALLYSVPCIEIAEIAKENPRVATEIIRDAIYTGVDANSTLADITATGGRLNILGAIEALQEECASLSLPSIKGPLEISKVRREGSNNLEVNYVTPDNSDHTLLVTDAAGKTIMHRDFTPPSVGRKVLFLETDQFPVGIYFITIYNESNIKTQKQYIHN